MTNGKVTFVVDEEYLCYLFIQANIVRQLPNINKHGIDLENLIEIDEALISI